MYQEYKESKGIGHVLFALSKYGEGHYGILRQIEVCQFGQKDIIYGGKPWGSFEFKEDGLHLEFVGEFSDYLYKEQFFKKNYYKDCPRKCMTIKHVVQELRNILTLQEGDNIRHCIDKGLSFDNYVFDSIKEKMSWYFHNNITYKKFWKESEWSHLAKCCIYKKGDK